MKIRKIIFLTTFIFFASAITEEQNALQQELNNLISDLENSNYSWLVNLNTGRLQNEN